MDQKAAYEITVTDKLEQLTVPDMADAIWARIETQLDIDMPTDDGPFEPPTKPSWGGGFGIGVIFIAALISIIYFVNSKPNSTNNDTTVSPTTPATISAPGTTNDKPPPSPGVVTPSRITTRQNDSAGLLPGTTTTTVADPAAGISQPTPDSSKAAPVVAAPLLITPPVDTTAKKSRGVKGIQDGDYRIVPTKKDNP